MQGLLLRLEDRYGAVGRAGAGCAGRNGQSSPVQRLYGWIAGAIARGFFPSTQTYKHSLTKGTIVSIERDGAQEDYWDLQVPGTNNYVTVDGTIHHNSGKSVACVVELLRRASMTPPGPDGIRRSRGAIIRNTLSQLRSTCLVTIEDWLRPIVHYKVSDQTIYVSAGDIRAEWLLLPLDTPQNVQRLLSLELTYAWCSEVRELPLEIVQAVFSRCGRYPSRSNVEDYWYGVWAETNSFSEDSEYYDFLEVERPGNVNYFVQPGGMEPLAENVENLPQRYYTDMLEANTEAWCDQYVHNKIGPSLSGQAVFASLFNYDFHTAEELQYEEGRPIIIGMDTGRNPAAVLGQMDVKGRLLVLGSAYAENMGMEKFVTTILKPWLIENFPMGRFVCVVDPAGTKRSEIGEESVIKALQRMGFLAAPAMTNAIDPRLRAVERQLNLQIDGRGAILIDRRHNAMLIRAISHDYRYKRKKEGDLNETPEKGHPESDLADALQYLCLGADSATVGKALRRQQRQEYTPTSAAGWT